MRILLLNPPAEGPVLRDYFCSTSAKAAYYWHPIDLLVQSGILSHVSRVEVLDAVCREWTVERSFSFVRASEPDAVLSLCGASSMKSDMDFLRSIRESCGCPVFAIGEPLLERPLEKLHYYPFLDGILDNFISSDLVHWLKRDFDRLAHGVFRVAGTNGSRCERVIQKHTPLEHGFRYPRPLHEQFRLKGYRLPFTPSPFATVLTTHGCPFKCSYCNSGWLGFATRDEDNILEEMDWLHAQGIRHIFFKDMTLGASRAHTRHLLERIIGSRLRFTWHGYARADAIDEDLLTLMRASGCRLLQFGVESANEQLLRGMGRNLPLRQTQHAFDTCRRMGIRIGAHFILGLPGETEQSIRSTIALARDLDPDFASFNILVPRHGSPMAGGAAQADQPLDSSTGAGAFGTIWVTRRRLQTLQRMAYRTFYMRPAYLRSLLSGSRVNNLPALFASGLRLLGAPRFSKHEAGQPTPKEG